MQEDYEEEEEEEELPPEEREEEYYHDDYQKDLEEEDEEFDYNYVRVTEHSYMRRQISYCISKLRNGESVTVAGMEHSLVKVI